MKAINLRTDYVKEAWDRALTGFSVKGKKRLYGIPANTSARIILSGGECRTVGAGRHVIES